MVHWPILPEVVLSGAATVSVAKSNLVKKSELCHVYYMTLIFIVKASTNLMKQTSEKLLSIFHSQDASLAKVPG